MKKYAIYVIVLLSLCPLLGGCFSRPVTEVIAEPTARSLPDYEDMEIYQALRNAVTEDSTLEEMVDAFEDMCSIPVETSSEMFLYEVGAYEFEGETYLNCHIVRQVDDPGTDEFIQLHMDIIYLLDEDMAGFEETTWFDANVEGFLEYIRNGEIYQALTGKPIDRRYVSIDSTW